MTRALSTAIAFLLLVSAVCHGTEHIEIVLDTSMEMWGSLPDGTPRIAAIRTALDAFVVSPAARGQNFEFGLRTIGGRSDITEDDGCADTESLIANGPVDPMRWSSALRDLEFRGGRALVHAVEKAVEDISILEGEKRVVVITSGGDQCHRDLATFFEGLSTAENPIAVRIVGLGMDQDLANLLILSTPTRNVNDPTKLLDSLRWAAAPQTSASTRADWIELMITRGEEPVDGATLYMVDRYLGKESSTPVVEGMAEIRLPQGRYRARIEGPGIAQVVLDDIVHLGTQGTFKVVLTVTPPVTLEVNPERPAAGGEAYIQYWGAPPGSNFVAVAAAGAPAGQYLVRRPSTGSTGEVSLPMPDFPYQLEVQFTRDIGSGIQQLLGQLEFETKRRNLTIEAPERAEIKTPITLNWSGDGMQGDHIVVEYSGDDIQEDVLCFPAFDGGTTEVNAPSLAGDYVVRYKSRRGQSVARASLEVFEILATLEGPMGAVPGEEIGVTWTGPDEEQDFLSIAALDESDDEYRSFTLTAAGNPSVLTAPNTLGDYEIRYVRATDGEILARQTLTVSAAEIAIEVPSVVEAGTRFEVAWTGTAGEGDFITVARHRSGPKQHLDWSYTDLGSPVTLAAPFEAGTYAVRYVSGTSNKVVARELIQIR